MAKTSSLTRLMKDVNKRINKVVEYSNKLAELASVTADLTEDAASLVASLNDEIFFQEESKKQESKKGSIKDA